MGNQIQKAEQSDWDFLRNLSEPMSVGESGTSSRLQIYRHRHVPTQFFLKISSAFIADQRSQQYLKLLKWLQQVDHPNMVRLFHFHVRESQLVCNRQLTLDCYYGFYNFRLSHVIDRKYVHRNSPTFKESQLWYIANSILSIIKELQQQKLPLGGFTSKDFFLTPEGELKYYPNQLRKDYSHVGFIRAIKDPGAVDDHYLAPEQLLALRTINYNDQDHYEVLTRGDMYSLGMVMLECLTMESSKQYYSTKNLDIKYQKLTNKLSKLTEMPRIVDFIHRCLSQTERIGAIQGLKFVGQFKIDHCINFFGEQDKQNQLPRPTSLAKCPSTNSVVKLRLR